MDNQTAEERKPGIFGTAFFFISFIPYIIVLYLSFHGVLFGLQGVGWFYGLLAMLFLLCYFIPLGGPLFIFYQITFARKYFRHRSTLKTAARTVTILLIATALVSCIGCGLSKDFHIRQAIDHDIKYYFISHDMQWDESAYIYCYSELEERYSVTTGGQSYGVGRNYGGFYIYPLESDEVYRYVTQNNNNYEG